VLRADFLSGHQETTIPLRADLSMFPSTKIVVGNDRHERYHNSWEDSVYDHFERRCT
jgi:hypothetical protein